MCSLPRRVVAASCWFPLALGLGHRERAPFHGQGAEVAGLAPSAGVEGGPIEGEGVLLRVHSHDFGGELSQVAMGPMERFGHCPSCSAFHILRLTVR